MIEKIKTILSMTFDEFLNDAAMRLAAALAYYSLFSIAPLLVLLIRIAGWILGGTSAQVSVLQYVTYIAGPDIAKTVRVIVEGASSSNGGSVAAVIGLITLMIGASGLFLELQASLNLIWNAPPSTGRAWAIVLRQRAFSFALVLGTGILLSLLMAASAALGAATEDIGALTGAPPFALRLWNNLLSFLLITVLVALVMKVVPDVKIAWLDVSIGAVVTAVLLLIGKAAIAFYLAHSSLASVFGAAASVIAVLVWIYYSAVIFFLGAEFTQVYAKVAGSFRRPAVIPDQNAFAAAQGRGSVRVVRSSGGTT